MRLVLVFYWCFFICFATNSFGYEEDEIAYFDYPINCFQYDPYSFNGRNLGVASLNGRHAGEDVNLLESETINVVGKGSLRTYKQDGSYPNGYGELYGVSTHKLNRNLKVVVGMVELGSLTFLCLFMDI